MEGLEIKGLQYLDVSPVSVHIEPATCVCLSGPSGIGKTLFLRAIADLDEHGGQVLLDGIDCQHYKAPVWRSKVSLLPADSQWWGDSVGEHFFHYNADWLDKLGFKKDVMTWQVNGLSTGERQRLALIRLLANHPQVLLLDEPTGSLDPENSLQVESLVNDYQNRTKAVVIWVSHDPDQIRRISQRHFVLSSNGLEEQEVS